MDKSLPVEKRLDSLHVLEQLDATNVELYPSLAMVLGDGQSPVNLRREILTYLIQTNFPGLGDQISAALPTANDEGLRVAIMDWLIQNPNHASFAQVVKLWAMEKRTSGDMENRYRQLAEHSAGAPWDQALFGALNSDDFAARGSALEILQARMSPEQLRSRIANIVARSESMKAMQYFSEHFGFFPHTGRELMAEVIASRNGPSALYPASVLAFQWQGQYGYHFNIRDVHLLAKLGADDARKQYTRQKLSADLLASVRARKLLRPSSSEYALPGKVLTLDSQIESLSMPDLWTAYLADRLLNQPQLRLALDARADKEGAHAQSVQLGGLVVFDQGRARASIYPPGERRSDAAYTASPKMVQESADAMCFFIAHFGPDKQQKVLGPSEREVTFARDYNLSGLVLTGLGQASLNACFFTPGGAIVDLGDYPPINQ